MILAASLLIHRALPIHRTRFGRLEHMFLIQVRSRPIDSARSKRAKCYLSLSSCEQEKTNFGQRVKTNFATNFHFPSRLLDNPMISADLPIFVLLSNPSKTLHHKRGMDHKMKWGGLFSTALHCNCAQASFHCFKI